MNTAASLLATKEPGVAPRIEFFYAIGSRYSYLAAAKLEQLASQAGVGDRVASSS